MLTEKEANKGKLVSEKRQNLLGGEDTDFIDCAKGIPQHLETVTCR